MFKPKTQIMKISINQMYRNAVNESAKLRDDIQKAVDEYHERVRCVSDKNERFLELDKISCKYNLSMRVLINLVTI
jgi:hypothetical protein